MKISAVIESRLNELQSIVRTNETFQTIPIPVKSSGYGSGVNGGELLMLALATCYCNDIYREAAKLKMVITGVQVECEADFEKEGEAGSNIIYSVKIDSPATPDEIESLIMRTDAVAEIHNTLRRGVEVRLNR
jgi:uncharacterized OsmC-like protein